MTRPVPRRADGRLRGPLGGLSGGPGPVGAEQLIKTATGRPNPAALSAIDG